MAQNGRAGSFQFRFSIDGIDVASVRLSRWAASLGDLRRFWREYVAPKLWRDVEGNLESEGGGVGGWVPLSPRYAAWKARRYPGKRILEREGRLFRSLVIANDGATVGPEGVLEMNAQAMIYGTTVPYARYHQRGGSKPGRPPARRFLFMPPGSSETFGRMLHAFAAEEADAAGLHAASARAYDTGGGLL